MFILTLSDVISLIAIFAVLGFLLYGSITEWWKQKRCKHDKVRENRACHAICRQCGKDLGFIGAWRDKQNIS